MSVTAGVSGAALATRAKLQGGISQTRVGRYWPGQAPKWAKESEEDHDDDDHVGKHKEKKVDVLDDKLERNKDDDPRLRRLGQTTRTESREQVRAEVVSTEEEENIEEEEEDVEALEERRSRIREKNLKRTREEADLLLPLEDEEEEVQDEEEEEESEYETDSEEMVFGIKMMKPIFVPKAKRDTVEERERMEAEEEALEKLAKIKMRMETKAIVVEEVRKDEERRKNVLQEEANLGDVDTDDEANEAEEYEAWKTRELGRIKRDKDARVAMTKEKEEVDKLRNMTEQERKEWESNDPKPPSSSSEKPKKKWKFMQRYYHKGAYFQEQGSDETDGIYQRDYSAPTGVDRLDKSVLREVMQVKRFGRSGGTKWTHLVKEDTTYGGKNKKDEEDKTKDWSVPWVSNVFLRRKYNKRMAAMDAPIARPRGSKKMKAW